MDLFLLAALAVLMVGAVYYCIKTLARYVGRVDRHPPLTRRLLGREAACVETIDGYLRPGRVWLDGQSWQAAEPLGRTIARDETVSVIGHKGTTLLVRPAAEEKDDPWPARLIGRSLVWYDSPNAQAELGGREWSLCLLPPGAKLKAGERASIIGVGADALFLEPVFSQNRSGSEMIGRTGKCVGAIEDHDRQGHIQIDGVFWQARSQSGDRIDSGDFVEVVDIDGLVLIVRPLQRRAD